ncbi:MAG TPA: hypothetical protein VKJ77_11795, partial [Caballeronia sp.]|nr:hypothetical protein [Caballeronia sp.]
MKGRFRRMPTAYRTGAAPWRWASMQHGRGYGSFGIRLAPLEPEPNMGKQAMEYRKLGGTDINVSLIGLG